MNHDVVDARVVPEGRMEVLSRVEVSKLLDTSRGGLYETFRNCSLAVLNTGNELDDGKELLERYRSFDIRVVPEERGIQLEVKGAPATAFVDGQMIKGIGEHLFAVLRDVVYVSDEIKGNPAIDLGPLVFQSLDNQCFSHARSIRHQLNLHNPKLGAFAA